VATENLSVSSAKSAKAKRKAGRPRQTEEEKATIKAKRDAGKTRKFSVGEEPNKRARF